MNDSSASASRRGELLHAVFIFSSATYSPPLSFTCPHQQAAVTERALRPRASPRLRGRARFFLRSTILSAPPGVSSPMSPDLFTAHACEETPFTARREVKRSPDLNQPSGVYSEAVSSAIL